MLRNLEVKCEIDKAFIDGLVSKTNIVERVISQAEYKNSKSLNKTDGRKQTRIKKFLNWMMQTGQVELVSKECVLILTEGDSAKSTAISGLSVVGRDRYGVFPLRGKMLNVKKASVDQIANNKEITNIKKILGLRNGVVYKDNSKVWPLRYGKIMVMTDQDVDGSHIKGLLFNIFHVMWPSLLKNDFIVSLVTPIMKVTKGKKVNHFIICLI